MQIGFESDKPDTKRRPSLFSGYKHTHNAPGNDSNSQEC